MFVIYIHIYIIYKYFFLLFYLAKYYVCVGISIMLLWLHRMHVQKGRPAEDQVSKVSKIFNCQIEAENTCVGKKMVEVSGCFMTLFFFGWHQELVPFLDLCSALAGSVGVSLRFVKAISGMHVGRCRNETWNCSLQETYPNKSTV